ISLSRLFPLWPHAAADTAHTARCVAACRLPAPVSVNPMPTLPLQSGTLAFKAILQLRMVSRASALPHRVADQRINPVLSSCTPAVLPQHRRRLQTVVDRMRPSSDTSRKNPERNLWR